MNRTIRTIALGLALGTAGCDTFLSGPGISENPNFPGDATAEQIFIGVQARGFLQMQSQFARTAAIWTQQLAGVNNQQRDYGSRYAMQEGDINNQFDGIYTAGGLIDIRRLRDMAVQAGDTRLQAIAMVWEAFSMGTYASLFGDLPYREAAIPGTAAPSIDPQEQIYADVQELLSDAITLFGGATSAPLETDLVYRGNPARWTAAAHTLKARFYLHVAPRFGTQAYQNALLHAELGINEAPANAVQAMHGQAPGDFRAFHGNTLDDGNIWSQFDEARSDIVANRRMVEILAQRDDPRLTAYFELTPDGEVRGADQFGVGGHAEPWSTFATERVLRSFRQPFITWAENRLIMAEVNFQLGNAAAALTNLNDVRQAVGLAPLGGPVTLEEIMVEKWIVQFQNIDAYADWRRTCFPRLVPGGPSFPTPAARVPGRYLYGETERLQNPHFENLSPAQQPADNWNFEPVSPCPPGNTGGELYPAPAP
jgi:starch-binding outer membrane protein, SusD/RagB family